MPGKYADYKQRGQHATSAVLLPPSVYLLRLQHRAHWPDIPSRHTQQTTRRSLQAAVVANGRASNRSGRPTPTPSSSHSWAGNPLIFFCLLLSSHSFPFIPNLFIYIYTVPFLPLVSLWTNLSLFLIVYYLFIILFLSLIQFNFLGLTKSPILASLPSATQLLLWPPFCLSRFTTFLPEIAGSLNFTKSKRWAEFTSTMRYIL